MRQKLACDARLTPPSLPEGGRRRTVMILKMKTMEKQHESGDFDDGSDIRHFK